MQCPRGHGAASVPRLPGCRVPQPCATFQARGDPPFLRWSLCANAVGGRKPLTSEQSFPGTVVCLTKAQSISVLPGRAGPHDLTRRSPQPGGLCPGWPGTSRLLPPDVSHPGSPVSRGPLFPSQTPQCRSGGSPPRPRSRRLAGCPLVAPCLPLQGGSSGCAGQGCVSTSLDPDRVAEPCKETVWSGLWAGQAGLWRGRMRFRKPGGWTRPCPAAVHSGAQGLSGLSLPPGASRQCGAPLRPCWGSERDEMTGTRVGVGLQKGPCGSVCPGLGLSAQVPRAGPPVPTTSRARTLPGEGFAPSDKWVVAQRQAVLGPSAPHLLLPSSSYFPSCACSAGHRSFCGPRPGRVSRLLALGRG